MESALVLIGLAMLAIPLIAIAALVMASGLKRRMGDAERRIQDLQLALETTDRTLRALQSGASDPRPDTPTPEPKTAPQVQVTAAEIIRPDSARVPPNRQNSTNPPRPAAPQQPVGPSLAAQLFAWMAENWFYVVSAISLALAGVFLVDYGMQNGLLPPPARVAAAMAFGLILIGVGEYIRRRWGDGTDKTTAYLPSVFSGAGIVTLFGGLLAARILYDLIGPETALIGMVLVALLALLLGWFHGPLLAAVGILGAFAGPFIVGGASDDPSWLYGYFAIVAALGLGIDTLRRWAWVSVLTLVCAFVAGPLIAVGEPNAVWAFTIYLAGLAALSVLIPARSLMPDQSGPMIVDVLRRLKKPWPAFPTLLAAGSILVSVGWLVVTAGAGRTEFWMSVLAVSALAAALTIWSRTAPALQDMTLIPVGGVLAVVFLQGATRDGVWRDFARAYEGNPEAAYPWAVTSLIALAAGVSALAVWRSRHPTEYPTVWATGAALFAPVTAVMVELTWQPSQALTAYTWALHAMVLAMGATLLAGMYARVDGPDDRLRTSIAALAAVATISFALTIVLDDDALTLALIATLVAAAALDRRFDLPAMTVFISIGVVAIGYRLVMGAEPGAVLYRPWASLIAVYAGAVAGFAAALWLIRPRTRVSADVMLETGLWSALGLTLSLSLFKIVDTVSVSDELSHWSLGLYGVIWLVLMLVQLRRSDLGGWMRFVRLGLASVFAALGFGAVLLAMTLSNPLLNLVGGPVKGLPLLNTLAIAYLLPAVLLAVAAWKLTALQFWMQRVFFGVAGVLTTLWAFSVMRHVWQGARGMDLQRGMSQPELYTYTIALLLLGAALFYQSLAKRNDMMRKAGLIVIGLSVAKVFFVDISGLQGLTRVFSLLALGLSLAGLAWLNRWAQSRTGSTDQDPNPISSPDVRQEPDPDPDSTPRA